ncbi:MAG: ADP-ribose pyrophosphatase [Candidatus Fraserbacteria bacterium RBG_16_55_9]|uniref:ADP-ribose pyrophosphatase n=1 Tax=Fraserbacteria sp. (strain RBG_16_55_9) TaxID=1817864 RepID=A0A1F5UY70_FRAXR|nr:MAG: ADP-ribose pyrophosphatase [Candidatus Fraserbacteria bacterium RBG_16_55_9]
MIDESWYTRTANASLRISSGGVVARVENGEVHVALVREVGVSSYVLPKGGVKRGETLLEAAHREIEEEAGLRELKLIEKLGIGEHLNLEKTTWVRAHYFLFITEQVDGIPTDMEHHYGLAWFPIHDLPELFWRDQRRLIETNRDKIVELTLKYKS